MWEGVRRQSIWDRRRRDLVEDAAHLTADFKRRDESDELRLTGGDEFVAKVFELRIVARGIGFIPATAAKHVVFSCFLQTKRLSITHVRRQRL
jgi:hypothetical protein